MDNSPEPRHKCNACNIIFSAELKKCPQCHKGDITFINIKPLVYIKDNKQYARDGTLIWSFADEKKEIDKVLDA